MICYVNYFKDTKKMYFKTSDNKLLKEYNKIWEKISCLMKGKFDSRPVYGDKYINTKVK